MKLKPLSHIILALIFTPLAVCGAIKDDLPNGLVLNLDFESVKDGLIPSKVLYPLHVPLGKLRLEWTYGRRMLVFQYGQGLDIPPSSLLEPNGEEWIMIVRAFCLTDGLIVSQANNKHGFAIYMKEGRIFAKVKTGHSPFTLQERVHQSLIKYTRHWVSIELRIRKNMAILYLNRKRMAMIMDQPALKGENCRIRLGNHNAVPAPFKGGINIMPEGFTGSINSFKILRQ